jgi:4-hydroxy-2-oxoheptanedioate aldolase
MLGIFSKTTDSNIIEAAGYAGLDFIILDQEHGGATLPILNNHVRAARVSGMKSYIRVAANQPHLISSALDTGADGVQIPNISSYSEAKDAVKAARFFPIGMRGVCRFVPAAKYGMKEKNSYFTEANQKTLILQVEGREGVKALDEILTIDGFDVLFVGPYDLSQSAGRPGDINHPDVMELIRTIAQKTIKSGKTLGTFADNIPNAKHLQSMGFKMIAYSVDMSLFAEKIIDLKKSLA